MLDFKNKSDKINFDNDLKIIKTICTEKYSNDNKYQGNYYELEEKLFTLTRYIVSECNFMNFENSLKGTRDLIRWIKSGYQRRNDPLSIIGEILKYNNQDKGFNVLYQDLLDTYNRTEIYFTNAHTTNKAEFKYVCEALCWTIDFAYYTYNKTT